MNRRLFLASGLIPLATFADPVRYPEVTPGRKLVFPRDHGAHPDYRIEWWYVTGWLDRSARLPDHLLPRAARGRERQPEPLQPAADPVRARRTLRPEARPAAARPARGARRASLAHAEPTAPGVWIDDWRLELEGNALPARDRGARLRLSTSPCSPTSCVLQGEGGFSRKGHRPAEASYYYSRPQLNVVGQAERRSDVEGTAWLDHEWSSAYLAPEASGWDWCGINLLDGTFADGFPHARTRTAACTTRRRALFRAAEHLEVAAHRRRVSGGDGGQRPAPRAADGRPGARRARAAPARSTGKARSAPRKRPRGRHAATWSSPATGNR